MGKRGPRSGAPGGYGSISNKGYRRIMCPAENRFRMEHVLVWESHHGPLASGMQVHHINEDKLDNRIENLQAMSALDHKRLHGGCEMRDGVWWKPCRKCGVFVKASDYYKRQDNGISPWCRPCCIANAVANKRRRKAAAGGERNE